MARESSSRRLPSSYVVLLRSLACSCRSPNLGSTFKNESKLCKGQEVHSLQIGHEFRRCQSLQRDGLTNTLAPLAVLCSTCSLKLFTAAAMAGRAEACVYVMACRATWLTASVLRRIMSLPMGIGRGRVWDPSMPLRLGSRRCCLLVCVPPAASRYSHEPLPHLKHLASMRR